MTAYVIALSLLWTTCLMAAEASRTWTSKQGVTLEGAMVGVESGMVLIKKTNGEIFKANLEALCPKDVAYVNTVSFGKAEKPSSAAGDDLFGDAGSTGRLIKVSMVVDPHPVLPSIKELGVSIRPKLNDNVQLHVNVTTQQNKETSPDSTWTIESIDVISGTLKPQNDGAEPLKTDGSFYFLTYSVENNMRGSSVIPVPIVKDSNNRKFYPLSALDNDPAAYIPEGMCSAERDMIQPGFKKRFCSIYELPKGCVANSLDLFPIRVTKFPSYSTLIRSGQLQGKSIDLSATASSGTSTNNASKTDDASEKANAFMACRQKALKTSTTGQIKTRVLSYIIDLRLMKPQQKEMTIKSYFIAADAQGDAIVDIVDQPVALQRGKLFSTTVECKPIAEGEIFNTTFGSKLKGVIIQLWSDGAVLSSWTSMSQWEKYTKMPDLQIQMRTIKVNSPEDITEFIENRNERKDLRPKDRRLRD